jgi:hypothetical protein
VFDTSGERFSVQLTNSARSPEKSQVVCRHSSSCSGVSWVTAGDGTRPAGYPPAVPVTSSVAWEVAGAPVTFRSQVELRPVPEAVGSAFLFPAGAMGGDLALPDPVDPRWRAGALDAAALARRWWGWRIPALHGPVGAGGRPGPGVALCFTGGLDSFHSLLCGRHRPTALLFAVGYDVPLDDGPRLEALLPRLGAVADGLSLPLTVVATDLRRHPLFARTSWERTHGAALAALGHLTGAGELLISGSATTGTDWPWGSHPALDGCWSSSRTLVRHVGFGPSRFAKAAAVGHHPLVRQHLQVCWERRTATGNCGRCAKCVVTMACLDAVDALERSSAFPPEARDHLAHRIDALPTGRYPHSTREALAATTRPDVAAALVRLLARMPRRSPAAGDWGRAQVVQARVRHAAGRRTPAVAKRWLRRAGQPRKTGSRFSK